MLMMTFNSAGNLNKFDINTLYAKAVTVSFAK